MQNIWDIQKLLSEEQLQNYTPVKHEVCIKCLDCCSDLVPFSRDEIKKFKKRHRKLFRGTKIVPHLDLFYIKNRSVGDAAGKCIFLKGTECIIYNERPEICKMFGSSPVSMCGLEGLDTCPPQEERDRLSRIAKQESFNIMEEIYNKNKGV